MKDLGDALSDVREAYWLVAAYQRRILDIAALVASQFESHTFYWWQPGVEGRPPRGDSDPSLGSAWHMLPMLKTSFLYTPPQPNKRYPSKGAWMLEVHVDALLSEVLDHTSSKSLSLGVSGSAAHPVLRLVAWKCTAATESDWYSAAWNATSDYPEIDGVADQHDDLGVHVLGYTYDLAELQDRDAVLRAVEKFK